MREGEQAALSDEEESCDPSLSDWFIILRAEERHLLFSENTHLLTN